MMVKSLITHESFFSKRMFFSRNVVSLQSNHQTKLLMEWMDIAAVVILVVMGFFIYRNKVNQNKQD